MHNAGSTITVLVEPFLAIEALTPEMILIDDASNDDSVARVRELGRVR